MPKFFSAPTITFFLASLVSVLLIYFKVEISWLQRIVAVLLLVLLIFLNYFLNPNKQQKLSSIVTKIFLFLGTLFVELIVISTGGLKSPFLVMIHIFTLGVSFLVNLPSALIFLFLSLITILANFLFDKNIQSLFADDPGSVLLYLISFVVIVPLSVLVTRYYYLKDSIANVLSRQIKQKDLQQKMVLEGLNELVVVTDKKLSVLSANDAAEKVLSSTSSAVLKRSIFDLLFLRDKNEKMQDPSTLEIEQIINTRQGKQFNDLFLFTKNSATPRKVSLVVKPIVNLEGVVDQLTFVISDNSRVFTEAKLIHANLEAAWIKQQAAVEEFKNKLAGSTDLTLRLEILERFQQDLLLSTEMEDHNVGGKSQLTDLAEVCKRMVIDEQAFAKALKVNLIFALLNFDSNDTSRIAPRGLNISPINLTAPFFTAGVDVKWFNFLIRKLIDMSVFLSSGIQNPTVEVSLDREGDKIVVINIKSNYPGLSEEEAKLLSTQYYGMLSGVTNLKFGSGLEGFIAKQISISLGIPLAVVSQKGDIGVNLQLKVMKNLNG
jgi:PAS domain-containing protein